LVLVLQEILQQKGINKIKVMPNWCQNNLRVYGDTIEISEFKKHSLTPADHNSPEDFDFTFEGLYPTPAEFTDEQSPDQLLPGWYEWRIDNWGTKWDAAETVILENSVDELCVSFETAWAPPTEWLKKVSLKFPNLNFVLDYIEEGQGFCGVLDISDGEIVDDYGDVQFVDSDGREVFYDAESSCWKYFGTNDCVYDESEDFYPTAINPYI
jgi:hypothetical protein